MGYKNEKYQSGVIFVQFHIFTWAILSVLLILRMEIVDCVCHYVPWIHCFLKWRYNNRWLAWNCEDVRFGTLYTKQGKKSFNSFYFNIYLKWWWYALHCYRASFRIYSSLTNVNRDGKRVFQSDCSEEHFNAYQKVLVTGCNSTGSQFLDISLFIIYW